jgi:predicted DsbA family dithiol-disulfide isomerase
VTTSAASEAASTQGHFWEIYQLLLAHTSIFTDADLTGYANELGLDVEQFWADIERHAAAGRIARDVASADASGVTGTPTFFINQRRHYGAYDIETLSAAVAAARSRASLLAVAGR